MEFNSLSFIAFFAVCFALYQLPIGWTGRKAFLLISSYVFYSAWNPPFVVLLWISTLTDWYAVKGIHRAKSQRTKKLFVLLSLIVNLGLLGYFKYAQLAVDTFADLLGSVGVDYQAPKLNIFLPIGISFYTFQTMSYTLDVYNGALKKSKSFLNFALYVTFFPQLIAGPIVRAGSFLPQCEESPKITAEHVFSGLTLLVIGVFAKMVLSDCFVGPVVNDVYAAAPNLGLYEAWAAAFGFMVQLFLDFSGYSLCALGIARALGFELIINFRYPFAAKGWADLWRRWHLSLSTWIRDYLYTPLAIAMARRAARFSKGARPLVRPVLSLLAVVITMVVMGLWHGASWMMAVWGLLNGGLLVIDNVISKRFRRKKWAQNSAVTLLVILVTFVVTCMTSVFFRSPSMETAYNVLTPMFSASESYVLYAQSALELKVMYLIVLITLVWHIVGRRGIFEHHWTRLPLPVRAVALAMMMFLIVTVDPGDEMFIYFQF